MAGGGFLQVLRIEGIHGLTSAVRPAIRLRSDAAPGNAVEVKAWPMEDGRIIGSQ